MKYLKRVKCKPCHAIIGVSVKLCEQPGSLWQRRGTLDWATLSPNDDYFFSIRILDYSFACYNTMRRSAPSRPHYVFIVDQPSEMALPCVVLSPFCGLCFQRILVRLVRVVVVVSFGIDIQKNCSLLWGTDNDNGSIRSWSSGSGG